MSTENSREIPLNAQLGLNMRRVHDHLHKKQLSRKNVFETRKIWIWMLFLPLTNSRTFGKLFKFYKFQFAYL